MSSTTHRTARPWRTARTGPPSGDSDAGPDVDGAEDDAEEGPQADPEVDLVHPRAAAEVDDAEHGQPGPSMEAKKRSEPKPNSLRGKNDFSHHR